ncbi:hypothetical protein M406DRAFT_69331 [Cryphonectria parasitica EP155]|uniref:Uncharacterized protein n=1 Tax=Cryphonectria parasitica (strain ATCC 38755 / EP155) TaxID=660469 RepID=A0A9P4Y630_CRYP1|nr:uncharacterized protein M406DRAFT_69331 [Cryphonectria parasitica EP155]KAF3767170.1 hypothetical protein M406DRAFT_69331 [Cryphonectria parasitica EP155]
MLFRSALCLLGLAASALASTRSVVPRSTTPTAPDTEYLFTVNLVVGTSYVLGQTPLGQRVFEPVVGGNFTGPLHGTVLGGLDDGLIDTDGTFDPNSAFLLQTWDGCQILCTATGHEPNVIATFDTACPAYDWLNKVVAYGSLVKTGTGIQADVWQSQSEESNLPQRLFPISQLEL